LFIVKLISNNMASASVCAKEKCQFWDKCYRKSKKHRDEYIHPGDNFVLEKKRVLEKPVRLTHDISVDENDPSPPLKTSLKRTRSQTKAEEEKNEPPKKERKTESPSTSDNVNDGEEDDQEEEKISCKIIRTDSDDEDDEEEKSDRKKCKYWDKCYQKGKQHKVDFYHPGDPEEKAEKKKGKQKAYIKPHINVSLLLAHKYEEKLCNPIGWWISEKLDGVRAYWNGRCFYSRLGNAFYAPEWFTKDLPGNLTLDGELFGGRGQFQSTVSIVKTPASPKWKDIKFHVFDAPDQPKRNFEQRMDLLKNYFETKKPKYAVFVEQVKCKSKEQLDEKLDKILGYGGEGLMIREPKSFYERTRSKTLLKIKKFYDAEAVVIGHERGKGVNQHRTGALRCRMACGKEFSCGSGLTDKNRNNPPKIGSIITYKFQELSKGGSPRFPVFLGVRIDMTEPKDAVIRKVTEEDA